jgi:hypothetical protein
LSTAPEDPGSIAAQATQERNMSTRKSIKAATQQAARRAMQAHIETMLANGWKIDQEFEGDAGVKFKFITYFYK